MRKQSLKQRASDENEVGSYVPGYTPELGKRLESIINDIGSLKASAEIVPCKPEQLAKWRDGKAKMPLYAAQRLCRATDKSVDMLLYGKDGMVAVVEFKKSGVDYDSLVAALIAVEELEDQNGLDFEPQDKATLVLTTYKGITDKG